MYFQNFEMESSGSTNISNKKSIKKSKKKKWKRGSVKNDESNFKDKMEVKYASDNLIYSRIRSRNNIFRIFLNNDRMDVLSKYQQGKKK